VGKNYVNGFHETAIDRKKKHVSDGTVRGKRCIRGENQQPLENSKNVPNNGFPGTVAKTKVRPPANLATGGDGSRRREKMSREG